LIVSGPAQGGAAHLFKATNAAAQIRALISVIEGRFTYPESRHANDGEREQVSVV